MVGSVQVFLSVFLFIIQVWAYINCSIWSRSILLLFPNLVFADKSYQYSHYFHSFVIYTTAHSQVLYVRPSKTESGIKKNVTKLWLFRDNPNCQLHPSLNCAWYTDFESWGSVLSEARTRLLILLIHLVRPYGKYYVRLACRLEWFRVANTVRRSIM